MDDLFCSHPSMKGLRNCDIRGADFCKFYKRPLKSDCKPGDIILEPDEEIDFVTYHSCVESTTKFVSKGVQTDYRESETQTDPWDPPYKIVKVHDDPEVLSLQNLSYGDGLPATLLEVNYILETRKHIGVTPEFDIGINEAFEKKKQLVCEQVKKDWNYKIAVENQKLLEKLTVMKSAVIEDLKKHSEKREKVLKNMWAQRKNEMSKKNLKLEQKLQKDLLTLESGLKNKEQNYSETDKKAIDNLEISFGQKIKKDTEGMDYMLSTYFLSNPAGLSNIKNWLEEKADGLTAQIPLSRKIKRTPRERLAEKAYQNVLDKKRTKLPPKVYREDYVKKETHLPPMKVENLADSLEFEEKKIDMVTVLQQALRGLAYQKQMLELIERHKDGLATILPHTSEIGTS